MLHLYAVTHRQRKLSECVSKLRRRRGKPAMVASHAIKRFLITCKRREFPAPLLLSIAKL